MAIVDLVMPKMGESIMEATILRWHKKVGDHVKQDETVLDIATDKVDSEVPSTVSGIIIEILFIDNDVVPVGTVIARVEVTASVVTPTHQPVTSSTQSSPIPQLEIPKPIITQTAPEPIPYVPQQQEYSAPKTGGNNRFFSPLVLNIANSEGLSLSELERIPGTGADGRVSKKDVLQYIADKRIGKVPAFVPAPQPIYTQPVQQQPVAAPAPQVIQAKQTEQIKPIVEVPKAVAEPAPVVIPQQIIVPQPEPVYVPPTPVAAVPQAPVTVKPIVEPTPAPVYESTYVAPIVQAQPEAPKPSVEIIEMDRMRKLIAKHMVDSKQTSAHVTSFAEADVTNMVLWRDKIKNDFEKKAGTKITFTPMFIESLVRVMKRYSIINSSVEGDRIMIKNYFNIGMATALPNKNLIVPVIKNAEQMGLVGLAKSVNDLAEAARTNKLRPDDTQGGTFTLTNVGSFGSLMGTPIINQPQVAILAVGVIKKRPVVVETDKCDFIAIRHMMYLSLSYDHRIIDGSVGASFLSEVAKEFEQWDVNRQLKLVVKEQFID
jgi:2-oxoglutarate dehydrogenase E2 component (dihydrolipoamide succinyltransferase)